MTSTISVGAVKKCETDLESFFSCLGQNTGDFNKCRTQYNTLASCAVSEVKEDKPGEAEEAAEDTNRSFSNKLRDWMPRVFKNVEELPRERTALADTLAKAVPAVFDPKEDDDEDD
eukprot:TRINITY_DN22976_c0_g1_i1.p2 TRINITY_DN22976_c0_g1~~TRINITY_DN22976_c0_g1_i1.p2  ORF type:complete len:116 (-),score=40.89 TRINITY_DN22976_c0_g1_i1:788-1135(-)